MFLMLWCPNAATDETRNMYKRSMDVLKQCLKDVKDFVEATNISEARLSVIKAKLQENSATEEDQIQIIDDSDDSMEVENGS
ncbi:unnamed protein product [Callosobruchus maculatus]|uniref:ADF-H domain-containing protein n=1 Tax=Callosobruchus maculatus TaxID=64391 RepID=A0A653DJG0_CALMS|nr:unnamed protein product [Callosobruchus maculatus]